MKDIRLAKTRASLPHSEELHWYCPLDDKQASGVNLEDLSESRRNGKIGKCRYVHEG
jgi:hypothetical protein